MSRHINSHLLRKLGMKIVAFAVVVIMLCSISGCTSKVKGEDLMKDIEKNKEMHCENVAVSGADISDFAVRLLQASEEKGKNTLISPMSVLCALAMTANGAKEETLEQMEKVLGLSVERLNHYIYGYMKVLPKEDTCKLSLANSIWFTDHERFTVNPNFLQMNADFYGADVYKTPFDDTTLKDINNWVKNETDGMIPEILDEIPKEAVMYLVNALAFEAEWQDVYTKGQVEKGIFTTENGNRQNIEFMSSEEGVYLVDDDAKGVLKYYKGGSYAFAALLPNEDISVSDYISKLDGEHLNKILENKQSAVVKTAIPKFETEYSTEMSKVLSTMGMPDAFDTDKADFTGLGTSTDGNIFINRVLHKTFISVGEQGTKAGAATVVEAADECALVSDEPKIVRLDRPFVYVLLDCTTNVPFFIGTMMSMQ